MSPSQSSKRPGAALTLAAMLALGSLGACDKKPSSLPTPKTGSAKEGPRTADYPAGIKPAPSVDEVAAVSTNK